MSDQDKIIAKIQHFYDFINQLKMDCETKLLTEVDNDYSYTSHYEVYNEIINEFKKVFKEIVYEE